MDGIDAEPEGGSAADARYRAPALDKGLDILEILAGQSGGLTRAELAKAMNRSPGEAYRMLERLVVRGYVARSPEGDRYALSLKLFTLAHRHPPLRRLVAPAQPLMDGFARAAGQSCHLVAAEGDRAMVVAQASSPGNWEFGLRLGAPVDLLETGSGQLLLAFADPDTLGEVRARWAGTERLDMLDALQAVFAEYRRARRRIADSRQIVGVRDVSVPVLSGRGHAVAVLTCPFVERHDGHHASIDEASAVLDGVARQLSLD